MATNSSNKPRQPTPGHEQNLKAVEVLWSYFHFSLYSRDNTTQKDRSLTLQATGLTKATPPRKGMQLPILKEECPDKEIHWTGRKWGPSFSWSQRFLNERNTKPWSTVPLWQRPVRHWHLAWSNTGKSLMISGFFSKTSYGGLNNFKNNFGFHSYGMKVIIWKHN